jgi:hypothetical protein
MNTITTIEALYLVTGMFLPIFYMPQIIQLYQDTTRLSSYSFSKATAQLILRLPALAFSAFVVQSPYMNIVLTFDVVGRLAEWVTAIYSMKKQAFTGQEMINRVLPEMARNFNKPSACADELPVCIGEVQMCREQLKSIQIAASGGLASEKAETQTTS